MREVFCRLCAETKEPEDVIDFSLNTKLGKEVFKNLLVITANTIDLSERSLPETACVSCCYTLSLCCNFVRKIRNSQIILRNHRKDGRIVKDTTVSHEMTNFSCVKQLLVEAENDQSSDVDNANVVRENNFVVEIEVEQNQELNGETYEVKAEFVGDSYEDVNQPSVSKLHACSTCGLTFSTLKQLQRHTTTHFPPRPRAPRTRKRMTIEDLTCKVCHKEFENPSKLRLHSVLHTDRTKDFPCDICGKLFFSDGAMKGHRKLHKSDPQECPICNKVFQNVYRLKYHLKMHEDIRYECDICNRNFSNRSKIISHLKTHTDILPFVCKTCGKAFRFKNCMKSHENIHLKVKPYACSECNRKFTMWSNCNKHMKRKHGLTLSKNDRAYRIEKVSFKDEPTIGLKIKTPKEINKHTDFVCEGCGKMFQTKTTLNVHKRIAHVSTETQSCKICNAKLANWSNLMKHMKNHKNENFECNDCDQVFNSKDKIKRHVRVHMDLYPYACEYCDRRFKRPSNYSSHMDTHAGVKPYYCSVCGQRFRLWSSCDYHMRLKHGTSMSETGDSLVQIENADNIDFIQT